MKKFEAPKVTCIEVITELLITASKLGIPTVSPQPFSYSAKEFSRLYNDHFKPYYEYIGCYKYMGDADNFVYGAKYHLYMKDNEYYFLPCY